MKKKHLILPALAALLVAGCVSEKQEQARLQAEAKVSREDALKVALARVPGATVKEAELEKEKGRLIWSFDLTTPGSKDISEVAVDAVTGELVAVETETAEHEAKEKSEDTKKEKDKD